MKGKGLGVAVMLSGHARCYFLFASGHRPHHGVRGGAFDGGELLNTKCVMNFTALRRGSLSRCGWCYMGST